VIDDPRRCDFRPARDLPKCPEGTDNSSCVTSGQIGALEKIYGDVMSQGERIFPGWPVGAEFADANGRSGWGQWLVHDGGPTTLVVFAGSFLHYMAFPEKGSKTDLANFDFDKDPARMAWIHEALDATDPDLSALLYRNTAES